MNSKKWRLLEILTMAAPTCGKELGGEEMGERRWGRGDGIEGLGGKDSKE
jgi:hypothetical protein